MTTETPTAIAKPEATVRGLLNTDAVKKRFEAVLGKKAAAFTSSILSAMAANPDLEKCAPMSVVSSASIAASLDLPITPGLGMAHIVPYGNKATFQMGWKGFVQLALRTREYRTINATPILEGQLVSRNTFTGLMVFQEKATSAKVVGYLNYFQLTNGYEKYLYMTVEELEAHAKRYSQTYKKGFGKWKEDFPAMALKTVVKLNLSKWGILSTELQSAIVHDQATSDETGKLTYPDAIEGEKASEEAPIAEPQMTAEKPVAPGIRVGKEGELPQEVISEAQAIALSASCKKHGIGKAAFDKYVKETFGLDDVKLLKATDYDALQKWIAEPLPDA